jgi:hypothetical protein
MVEADNLEQELKNAESILEETTAEVTETVESTETTTETEGEVVSPSKEDEEHGEKSRLGRKVKRLEETISKIGSSLDFIKEKITAKQAVVEDEEPYLPEGATSEEIKDFIKKDRERLLKQLETKEVEKSQAQSNQRQKYVTEYSKMVEDMLDPDEDAEIFKLMTDTKDLTFNQVHSGFSDAKQDFLINYRAATKAVLNKVKPVTKTTVSNKTSKIPNGVNVPGGTKQSVKAVDTSKWSAEEQELAKMFSAEELSGMGIV